MDNHRMVTGQSIFLILVVLLSACHSNLNEVIITSPQNINKVSISIDEGKLLYQINHEKKLIVLPSRLGFIFKNGLSFSDGFKIKDVQFSKVDETWQQPWGSVKTIRNHYQEAIISLSSSSDPENKMDLIVRAYDDGIALRYYVQGLGENKEVVIQDELTEFNLAEDAQSWWIKAYQPSRYEQLYESTKISLIDTVHTPLTMRFDDGIHVSIHEAALTDYSSMQIAGSDKSTHLNCDLAPWSNGDKVRTVVPFMTPWRTIKIANTAAVLLASHLTLNCNPDNKLGEVSWIKPSKYIGIWWGMIVGKWTWGEGPRHGATVDRAKKYIDFAAKNGFDEVLIEGISAGFTGLFPGDTVTTSFTETTSDFDLELVQHYAKSKGVSLQSYQESSASTRNYLIQVDTAFAQLKSLGIQKAKIGHVGAMLDKSEYHYGQHGVNYYRDVLTKAAEYQVAVNFHEPIKDTGERRTYPNMLTREGARGMEYNAWGNGGNPVDHASILSFTRLLESPMDFTPGIFDLMYENFDFDKGVEFPVKITLLDQGNAYTNIRYKGSESYWQSKPMMRELIIEGKDTTYQWTLTEMMKPGEWEWGISVHDIATDNNNTWLLNILGKPNQKIQVSKEGQVKGDVLMTLADQGIAPKNRMKASKEDLEVVFPNEFGKTQRVNTTLAKQLAYYVVIYSPIQMAADFIENYEDVPAFQFIKDVPVDWDTTVVINGEIGEYVTIARRDRNSQDWYLGSITNEEARTFDVDLSFLDAKGGYTAEIYADGPKADWELNPYEMSIGNESVGTSYEIKLARGGGHAVRFKHEDSE
ncbi:glycoside hydrolase family 97 protein [Cyclobacteriaceae bacterium]|nr:glycoside hydrolase family 97 protein [Cyclobacteriaceae bacterium]MDB4316122.1 glycoside hydrolase family 97 protein [Cyclobacteriaceae bacterium]MDB4742466.1 glycoside hydrolase family 97 protein [Cyclobacteriaceae bacterium]